jgi:hypothetical protein
MCSATLTSEDPVVAAAIEHEEIHEANAVIGNKEEEEEEAVVVEESSSPIPSSHSQPDTSYPGTICLSGRISPALRALITTWILLRQEESSNDMKEQQQQQQSMVLLEALCSIAANDTHLMAHAKVLAELDVGGADLVLVNGNDCRGAPLDESLHQLAEGGDFSLVFHKPGGDVWWKQLLLLKPAASSASASASNDTNHHYLDKDDTETDTCNNYASYTEGQPSNFWVDLNCERSDVVTQVPVVTEGSTDTAGGSTEKSNSKKSKTKKVVRQELCLGELPVNPPMWLQTAPVLQGDQILEVNGKTFLQELDTNDAQVTISNLYHCDPAYFSLVVKTPLNKRPADKWRATLRKTAVALGGGVMVSAGTYLPVHKQ